MFLAPAFTRDVVDPARVDDATFARAVKSVCGICGEVRLDSGTPDPRRVDAMLAAMIHRGPDGGGASRHANVVVGARRLAVVDVAHAHQPMTSDDGELTIVFNGEIYNHNALRAQLASTGIRFHTRGDTEVLLALYRAHGPSMLQMLEGMFAFCVVDSANDETFIARDRVGIKPLYYVLDDEKLVFASEVAVLRAHGALRLTTSAPSLVEALTTQFVWGDASVFSEVKKLLPGHTLSVKRGVVTVAAALNAPLTAEETGPVSSSDVVETLRASVHQELDADVPVGVFLSGGIDSAAVLALASERARDRVRAYSVGIVGGARNTFDERALARLSARRANAIHHELIVTEDDVARELTSLIDVSGVPILDPAIVPTRMLARVAKERVTVVLTGEGSDELFGGYKRIAFAHRAAKYLGLPTTTMATFVAPLAARVPRRHRLRQAMTSLTARSANERHVRWMLSDDVTTLRTLFDPALFDASMARLSARVEVHANATTDGANGLRGMLAVDVNEWLPHTLLEKVDLATMGASLEARVPFLSNRMLQLAARLDDKQRIAAGVGKQILRDACRGLVDERIRVGKKRGFDLPLSMWVNGALRPLVDRVFFGNAFEHWPGLQASSARALLAAHRRGNAEHGRVIFLLTTIGAWLEGGAP